MIARCWPLVTARAVDRAFDYAVPAGLADDVRRGSLVQVDFGDRPVAAVVAGTGEGPEDDLKAVLEVTGAISPALVDLAEWIAAECGSTVARALALMQPPAPAKRALKPVAAVRPQPPVELSTAQEEAVGACLEVLDSGGGDVLLHGVTGSGKTEVYLRVIERSLALGRGAIVLVPEIALTPQTARRFRARFGPTVAVLHSGSPGPGAATSTAASAEGEARVVVGARSAVFAAMPRLGVIVVDEEHDASYKHESDPRYDARRVAAKRARLEGAVAVFGSATPRPESWYGIKRKVTLPARIGGAGLPHVVTVDLRHDGGYPMTRPLVDALARIEDERRARDRAAEPARVGHGASLPLVCHQLALPSLRRLADAPRADPPLPSLRPLRAEAARLPQLRIGRSGPHRRGDGRHRARAAGPVPGARGDAARRRRRGCGR